LSRIINLESAGKERTRLTKAIVLAVRELAQITEPGAEARDLAAFIAMALTIVAETIDVSVAAWEKRGYWVKADKFRMEWAWAGKLAEKMRDAILAEDWTGIAQAATSIAGRLSRITIPAGHRLGRPWVGAWNKLLMQ
jgi:aldehyde:ferredoxin oxidoreductase